MVQIIVSNLEYRFVNYVMHKKIFRTGQKFFFLVFVKMNLKKSAFEDLMSILGAHCVGHRCLFWVLKVNKIFVKEHVERKVLKYTKIRKKERGKIKRSLDERHT
jgi:hypothetical protein